MGRKIDQLKAVNGDGGSVVSGGGGREDRLQYVVNSPAESMVGVGSSNGDPTGPPGGTKVSAEHIFKQMETVAPASPQPLSHKVHSYVIRHILTYFLDNIHRKDFSTNLSRFVIHYLQFYIVLQFSIILVSQRCP